MLAVAFKEWAVICAELAAGRQSVAPGEIVVINKDGVRSVNPWAGTSQPHAFCIFEYVYFARPDTIIDKISVYKARRRMGDKLADKIQRLRPNHDIDVVIPIPDTSRTSALQLANKLGVKYREGFIKNRYIGRTFIMPGQTIRRKSVRQKLNVMAMEFRGKSVLIVDDSIVRGTTSREIVQMARDAGARKVYMASAAPPVRYPNVYGIDMPTSEELVAHNRSVEEIRQLIGCDALIYQDVEAMKHAVGQAAGASAPARQGFEASCFDGVYITGDVTAQDIHRLHSQRVGQSEEGDDASRLALPNATD